jgi:hypothetical protein
MGDEIGDSICSPHTVAHRSIPAGRWPWVAGVGVVGELGDEEGSRFGALDGGRLTDGDGSGGELGWWEKLVGGADNGLMVQFLGSQRDSEAWGSLRHGQLGWRGWVVVGDVEHPVEEEVTIEDLAPGSLGIRSGLESVQLAEGMKAVWLAGFDGDGEAGAVVATMSFGWRGVKR